MKTILVFGICFGFISSLFAQGNPQFPAQGHWYLQGEGGVGFPISSEEATLYDPGYSAEIQVGYNFNKDFALGLEGRRDFLPLDQQEAILMLEQQYGITGVTGTTTAGFTHFSLDLVGRYYPPFFEPLRLYLFCGVGVAFDSFGGNYNGSWGGNSYAGGFTQENWTNFELVPGLGVAFPISNRLNAFVEGKVILDYSATDGPTPESIDTPIVGIPVQAGLSLTLP